MFRNSRGPDTQGVSMSIPPDVEPIINDYHQLLLLALNGTGRYITLGPIVAPQTGFNIPNDKDILYASRLNQYLAWCTHASNQTNRLGLLILLSAVFDQITQKDTKPRALLAGIIAHSFVQIKKTEGSSRKIFQSPVFSTKSLLIYNDLNHIYHTYGEADKDTKNYRAEMVGNILAASCMQYSEDTQHAIKKEARKIHKKLGGPLKIFSTDLPSVFSMPPPQILCDKPAEKDSLAATALTPTIVAR